MHRFCVLSALAVLSAVSTRAADIEPVWAKKCAGCHGHDGRAKTEAGEKHHIPDFTTPNFQAKWSDAQLREAITLGVKGTKMPGFAAKLSAEEVAALVAYIRVLKP